MNFVENLSGKKCLVIGAGVTGKAVAKALIGFQATPILFDDNPNSHEEVVTEIPNGINLAIVSPGWRMDHPVFDQLKKSGVEIFSEIDFAWMVKQVVAPNQKWIGLTGTNGKTTTIKMVETIFKSANINGAACGNVGQTVIESVLSQKQFDFLALELSSFQIQWSEHPEYESVALLNIAEDHIDWHGSFDNYAKAKLKLINQIKNWLPESKTNLLFGFHWILQNQVN
jgi:UDP-N-acetylmuramoylalanine--D-glutamate ligase